MLIKWVVRSALTLVFLALFGAGGMLAVLWHYSVGLPDYQQLADYQPPTMTRVHAGDGRLLAEYALERRIFVPVGAMPALVTKAFIATEDKNFYTHQGVDLGGVVRAAIQNAVNFGRNRRPSGASTITQQLAKNMLLTNEVSIARKVKEAILAFRIERALTKERILELYLNEIYLGQGSYGVAAAALNYFNKPLDQLTIAEAAYLAGLPKGPNNYNPVQYPERAKNRRDYVIDRMAEDGYIADPAAEAAKAEPIELRRRDSEETVRADYFAEEVRRELFARYGEAGLYKGGLSVRTTLEPKLQTIADHVLREGLIAYDRHHGWRGPLSKGAATKDWATSLAALTVPSGAGTWQLAIVLKLDEQGADIGLKGGAHGRIPFAELQWAKPVLPEQRWGNPPRRPAEVFTVGDVILVEPVVLGADGKSKYPADSYGLRQIPDVGGGLVALDPHTGRVLAMTGGLSYEISQFNRATQAMRQPGSSFKPFVYMAALDNGYTPSTIVLDAPFVIDQGPGLPKWKPTNFEDHFLGPIPVRVAIEQSKNLATVRVAESIGMEKVAQYAERFGVVDHLPLYLSMSLGAAETTLLRMTTAYAMVVNGGKRIEPTFIDRIQDRQGRTILRHDQRNCVGCSPLAWDHGPPPDLPDEREQLVDPATAYQMVAILQGVIDSPHGTGHFAISGLHRPLAGKTGTTNDSDSVWFIGFSPDLAVGMYVGFDQPRTLGAKDTGGSVCAPMFRDFMADALRDVPATPFRIPPGVRLVRVNPDTGRLAQAGDARVIYEAFKPGTEPRLDAPSEPVNGASSETSSGATLGGLY
jgi:penicillin-binding protein 1A